MAKPLKLSKLVHLFTLIFQYDIHKNDLEIQYYQPDLISRTSERTSYLFSLVYNMFANEFKIKTIKYILKCKLLTTICTPAQNKKKNIRARQEQLSVSLAALIKDAAGTEHRLWH